MFPLCRGLVGGGRGGSSDMVVPHSFATTNGAKLVTLELHPSDPHDRREVTRARRAPRARERPVELDRVHPRISGSPVGAAPPGHARSLFDVDRREPVLRGARPRRGQAQRERGQR